MVLPIVAFWGFCKICAVAIGTGVCAHKITKSFNKHEKTKKEKLALKGKSLEEARKDNERLNNLEEKIDKSLKKGEEQEKKLLEDIKSTKKELDDPNISPEKETELRNKLAFMQTQLDEVRRSNEKSRKEQEKIAKERENNNKVIAGIGLNTNERHWIWELITLENILILGACYALYKIANSKDKEN